MAERVHLASPARPYTLCGSMSASERRTKEPTEATCPFCSALYLADHPEYVLPDREEAADPEVAERRRAFRASLRGGGGS